MSPHITSNTPFTPLPQKARLAIHDDRKKYRTALLLRKMLANGQNGARAAGFLFPCGKWALKSIKGPSHIKSTDVSRGTVLVTFFENQ